MAPDRQKHSQLNVQTGEVVHEAPPSTPDGVPQEPAESVTEAMRDKLRTTAGKAIYKMRKAVVEPVFGQIKERRRLRGFLLRGRDKVAAEWQIICLTHNLLKLFRAELRPVSA